MKDFCYFSNNEVSTFFDLISYCEQLLTDLVIKNTQIQA